MLARNGRQSGTPPPGSELFASCWLDKLPDPNLRWLLMFEATSESGMLFARMARHVKGSFSLSLCRALSSSPLLLLCKCDHVWGQPSARAK